MYKLFKKLYRIHKNYLHEPANLAHAVFKFATTSPEPKMLPTLKKDRITYQANVLCILVIYNSL